MKGTALIYRPREAEPEVMPMVRPPSLTALQQAVGGYIELVPYLDHIDYDGKREPCLAFCNEHGKLEQQAFNRAATEIWEKAVGAALRDRSGNYKDFLVGRIIILFGDAEFMAALRDGEGEL
jgi:hypothetical protein